MHRYLYSPFAQPQLRPKFSVGNRAIGTGQNDLQPVEQLSLSPPPVFGLKTAHHALQECGNPAPLEQHVWAEVVRRLGLIAGFRILAVE